MITAVCGYAISPQKVQLLYILVIKLNLAVTVKKQTTEGNKMQCIQANYVSHAGAG